MNIEQALTLTAVERRVLDGSRVASIDGYITRTEPALRPLACAMATVGLVEDGVRSSHAAAMCAIIRRRVESRERGPRDVFRG